MYTKMGTLSTASAEKKWESSDCLFRSIKIQLEINVPTADPLLIPSFQRRRYGCKFIQEVKPAGTKTVYLFGYDCTAVELQKEYIDIVNKNLGHATEEDDEV